jgi:hypothetical protein
MPSGCIEAATMSTIDPSNRLAAAVHGEVQAFRARHGPNSARARATTQSAAHSGVRALVAHRVRALDRDDPRRKHKAVRIFLESVLLYELGAQLVQDSSFADMVDAVQVQMQGDPQLAAAVDQLGAFLLSA